MESGTAAIERPSDLHSLQEWLTYTRSVHWQNWDLGLERMHLMVERMQLHRPAPMIYTVAGTNGKGSTCLALEAGLMGLGKTVACTLSPHIVQFNEQFRLNAVEAQDQQIVAAFAAVDDARQEQSLSPFEFSSLAFLWFAQQADVDAVVLEIGLGGRLDAFNAVDADVAVITSIDFDHEQYLGDTLDQIGAEKAGILREGQRVVLGPDLPDSIFDRCTQLQLKPLQYGQDFSANSEIKSGCQDAHLQVSLKNSGLWEGSHPGNIAGQNVAVAAQALAVSISASDSQLDSMMLRMVNASIPGRFETVIHEQRRWVLDVAHNVAGARFLLECVRAEGFSVKAIICAILVDKHHQDFIRAVAAEIEAPWLVLGSQGERGYSAESLAKDAHAVQVSATAVDNMSEAAAKVLSFTQPQDVILCIGSFNLIEQFHHYASS